MCLGAWVLGCLVVGLVSRGRDQRFWDWIEVRNIIEGVVIEEAARSKTSGFPACFGIQNMKAMTIEIAAGNGILISRQQELCPKGVFRDEDLT